MTIKVELYNGGEGITTETYEHVTSWWVGEFFIHVELDGGQLLFQKDQVLAMEVYDNV